MIITSPETLKPSIAEAVTLLPWTSTVRFATRFRISEPMNSVCPTTYSPMVSKAPAYGPGQVTANSERVHLWWLR